MNRYRPTTSTCITTIGLLYTLACVRPSTFPAPETPPSQPTQEQPPPSIPKPINSSASWQLSPTSESRRYNTVSTTSIQKVGETDQALDSITTRAQYHLSTIRSSTSAAFTGSIDSFTSQTGNRIGNELMNFSFPIPFAGQIQNHQLQLDVRNGSRSTEISSIPCALPGQTMLANVERNLFLTPLQLQAGMVWEDTLTSTSCNGEITLHLTTIRNYKVLDETSLNGISVIAIDLTEKTLSIGEGSQNQHRILVTGEGNGSGRLYLDPGTGLLFNFSAQIQTTLHIQTSGRLQQFLQISKQTVVQI
jgi:hypothetical protein